MLVLAFQKGNILLTIEEKQSLQSDLCGVNCEYFGKAWFEHANILLIWLMMIVSLQ